MLSQVEGQSRWIERKVEVEGQIGSRVEGWSGTIVREDRDSITHLAAL